MHLSTSEQQLLSSVFEALLHYANAQLRIVRTNPDESTPLDRQLQASLVARALWQHLSIIDDFVSCNPADLSPKELDIARDLRFVLYDDLIYDGTKNGQGVFLHETGTYLTCGYDDTSFSRLPSCPVRIRGALAPVMGRIVAVMPLTLIGEPTTVQREAMRAEQEKHGAQEPTDDGALFVERMRTWHKHHPQKRNHAEPAASQDQQPGPGYHRGVLSGLVGQARRRACDSHYDLVAHESGSFQQLMEARSVEASFFPISLEECLQVLDDDWLASAAHHVDSLDITQDTPRETLIRLICERLPHDRAQRDNALLWCEEPQFDLLRRLMHTNPIALNKVPPSLALKLYPMIPYVFILREDSTFVAWIPPEIRKLLSEVDLDDVAHERARLAQAEHAASALASMCGVITLDEAFKRYCAEASDPFDRADFEQALVDLETNATRDSYALWTYEGVRFIISSELADESALARVIRWSYADRIIKTPHAPADAPALVDMTGADEREFEQRLNIELEHLDRARRSLADTKRDLQPHGLSTPMLERSFVEYLLESEPLVRVRAYVDRHVPDDQDDYTFPDMFAQALVVSILFEQDTYEDVLDLVRLFGMLDCEGEQFPHTLGRLITDAFNMLPRWELNGWSLAENTERITGVPHKPSSAA